MKNKKKISTDIIILFFTVILIFASNFYFQRDLLDPFRFPKLFLQIMVISYMIMIFTIFNTNKISELFYKKHYYLLYAFLFFAMISYFTAGFNPEGPEYLYIIFIHTAFFIILSHTLKKHKLYYSILIVSLISIAFSISLYSILQILNIDPIFSLNMERASIGEFLRFSPTGFTGNTNVFSGTIISIIPLLFCLTVYAKGRSKIFLLFINISILIPLLISMTRGVIIGIIISFIYAISNKKYTKTALATLLVLIILFGIYSIYSDDVYGDRIISIVTLEDEAIQFRLYIYRITLFMIRDNLLFGTGPNTFYREFTHYRYKYLLNNPHLHENEAFINLTRAYPQQAHNDILQNISETGIIANLFLIIFMIHMLFKKINNKQESYNIGKIEIPVHILFNYLKLSLIVFIINALFNFPFHYATSALNFIIVLSMLEGLKNSKDE